MSPTRPYGGGVAAVISNEDFDDAEKGLYDSTQSLPVIPPAARLDDEKMPIHIETVLSAFSPIHEGLTPLSSMTALSPMVSRYLEATSPSPEPLAKLPARPKAKVSRWILFRLWFNTYRKFFTFVTTLNLTGIVLTACGRFPYAENHLGALVLGNLLCAILMRNELFLRILYTIAIYGLKWVRAKPPPPPPPPRLLCRLRGRPLMGILALISGLP